MLLATFKDRVSRQQVTLAQFFSFKEAQGKPERFYVVAEKELKIATDFSQFDRSVATLKKRLKSDGKIQVFDDYNRYAQSFRQKMGIEQERALELFQQTISMKKVEALTDFVRENMLQLPDTEAEVKELVNHFQDLNSAHEAIIKAKEQIQQLEPLARWGGEHRQAEKEQQMLTQMKDALAPWFAGQKAELLTAAIVEKERERVMAEAAYEQAAADQADTEEAVRKLQIARYASGGRAIEDLEKEIASAGKALTDRQRNLDNYSRYSRQLNLSSPHSLEAFMENRLKLPALKSAEENALGKLREDLALAITEGEGRRQELKKIEEELDSLRLRKSSIPRALVEKRQRLCQATGIGEEALPFAGELLEIREGEEAWEGAVERLLHNFALSLLVPDQHYRTVMEWVNKTDLGLRLVYYRIDPRKVQPFAGQSHPLAVAQKLNIKPNTPFDLWLVRELRQRFSHVCCQDVEQFQREPQAVTQAGQIKTPGGRHEKDDRHRLNDRRNFVLGFSNQKKIKVLEDAAKGLREEASFYEGEVRLTEEKQQAAQSRLNAIGRLEDDYPDFANIDTDSLKKEIADKKDRKHKLERENDQLKELDRQMQELEAQLASQKKVCEEALRRQGGIKSKLEDFYKLREENKKTVADASPAMQQEVYPRLEERKSQALGKEKLTLGRADEQERKYREWIEGKAGNIHNEIKDLIGRIVGAMSKYCNKYPEETKELAADIGALPEYEAILGQLTKDDLPRFEQRFKQLLKENTINQITLFQAKLRKEQEIIKSRIQQINESLSDIDYNEGRYIRLEYDETYDTDIKSFRVQLKACTEGTLTGSEDEQYAETKFIQVREIIERFRGREGATESDQRWTKKVTDVRNWFLFAASERWRETDEEYEHYTDSGGKSGGQKEKLAYTILAASLVYHFGLEGQGRKKSFRFVVIDEAFLKSSDESARFGLELFKRMDLQLLIVTPLLKIPTIAQFISHVGFVHHDDVKHQSMLRNISIEGYQWERQEREARQHVQVVGN